MSFVLWWVALGLLTFVGIWWIVFNLGNWMSENHPYDVEIQQKVFQSQFLLQTGWPVFAAICVIIWPLMILFFIAATIKGMIK